MKSTVLFCLLLLSSSFTIFCQISAVRTPIAGLKKEVAIRRDGRGIPYIEATSDADVYFAQGYATASDRLWQMDLMRRLARGETAEIFGRAALEEDKRWRRFGFAKSSEQNLEFLSTDLRSALDNYARGVMPTSLHSTTAFCR